MFKKLNGTNMKVFNEKYNRKAIITRAWEFVKKYSWSFSKAMKKSWEIAKSVMEDKKQDFIKRSFVYEKQPLVSAENQFDFSTYETKRVTGFRQSTIAR